MGFLQTGFLQRAGSKIGGFLGKGAEGLGKGAYAALKFGNSMPKYFYGGGAIGVGGGLATAYFNRNLDDPRRQGLGWYTKGALMGGLAGAGLGIGVGGIAIGCNRGFNAFKASQKL